MNRPLKFISASIAAVIVAIIVVVAVLSMNSAPHFAFPSYQQVNGASGSSYTAQKYSNSSYSNGSVGNGAVKIETMNYTSAKPFLEVGIVQYKTAGDAANNYISMNNSIAKIAASLPNMTTAHATYRGYAYAYVIMPHNITVYGTTLHLGISIAVCHLDNFIFVMYSNFAGMNAGRMTGLIDLQINVMTGGSLI
ncbi:MAG: hypothetical protein KIS30_07805 [Thermoplasmata archaeon]|nr:hypothetical protein [Candidatus Sysuiplasma acidicola]MBX8646643.1 hypothetical protein [Candidatus Sysuiplasma acidicola]MDH2905922.1 hypothetical protein [Methanomassiliicoccales archaeon]